jgi:geranylgeranyl transferase type-1 subunit beta
MSVQSHIAIPGGPTYIALASLHLAPRAGGVLPLTTEERSKSIRWLIHNQDKSGGFRGRTGKQPDTCFSFWCSAALKVSKWKKTAQSIDVLCRFWEPQTS